MDVTASTAELGKTAGKDEAVAKTTYPKLLGLDQSKVRGLQGPSWITGLDQSKVWVPQDPSWVDQSKVRGCRVHRGSRAVFC